MTSHATVITPTEQQRIERAAQELNDVLQQVQARHPERRISFYLDGTHGLHLMNEDPEDWKFDQQNIAFTTRLNAGGGLVTMNGIFDEAIAQRAREAERQAKIIAEAREVLKRAQAMKLSSGEMADRVHAARHSLNPFLKSPEDVRDHYAVAQLDSDLRREWMRHRY